MKSWQLIGIGALASLLLANQTLAAATPTNQSPANAQQTQVQTQPERWVNQGRERYQTGRYLEAISAWENAAASYSSSGDNLNRALTLNYLSLAYQKLGRWEAAEEAIATSLSLLETEKKTETHSSILASALNSQGHLQLAMGRSQRALESWQQAERAYTKANDISGTIGSQINQVQALQNLGFYRRASITLKQVEILVSDQPDSPVKATGLQSIGNALLAIGELENARERLQQSIDIARKINAKEALAASYISLGNAVKALAERSRELNDPQTAKTELQNALDAYQKAALSSQVPLTQLEAQLNQLHLFLETEDLSQVTQLLPQLPAKIAQLPASRRSIYARINLAKGLQETNDEFKQIAAQLLAAAIQQARHLQDDRAESYALGNLGQLYESVRQQSHAQTLTQQALLKSQLIGAAEISYRWHWQLGRIHNAKGEKERAIAAYETAYETLRSLRGDLVAINPDNPDVQFSFRESVEPVYREYVTLLLQTEGDSNKQTNLKQARNVIESLQLAELDNFFREACLDTQPIVIDEVDSQAASIYPIILENRIDIILSLPNQPLRHYTTFIPQQEIDTTLRQLRQDLGRITASKQQILQLSQTAYNWIIRPIEPELQRHGVQTLAFVLDGLLRNIPMAVLYDGERYLIENYSIALTPGLQLLETEPTAREALTALAAGLSEARQGFSPLPNVEVELGQIQQQVSSQVLLNQNFTSAALQENFSLSSFPIVHIATHGQFSSQAENTFILAWDSKINVKELDAFLRTREAETAIPIELLVFSACETADGDDRAALGLAGVAVRAGARSTLATLWQVSDRSTAELMAKFYQEIGKGATKAEALRRAQIGLLKQRRYAIPYFWAPYVLVGNWL